MAFTRIEKTILKIIAVMVLCSLALIFIKDMPIRIDPFVVHLVAAVIFLSGGQYYRVYRSEEKLSAICTFSGLYVLFAPLCILYNTSLLPLNTSPFDTAFVEIDALFGYSWPVWSAWLAQYPALSAVLKLVYALAPTLSFLVIAYLGFKSDFTRLHTLAFTNIIAAIVTISIWVFLPTAGPGGVFVLPVEVESALKLTATSEYGAKVTDMIVNGIGDRWDISVTGLIGFPSFHITMGFAPLLAVWHQPTLRIVFLILFLPMIPATLIHGAHHLMDVIGGMVCTLAAWWLAAKYCASGEQTAPRQVLAPDNVSTAG
ncbi:MAG: phosphatase PAP2 family protein [Rhizobiaceae bacterium]